MLAHVIPLLPLALDCGCCFGFESTREVFASVLSTRECWASDGAREDRFFALRMPNRHPVLGVVDSRALVRLTIRAWVALGFSFSESPSSSSNLEVPGHSELGFGFPLMPCRTWLLTDEIGQSAREPEDFVVACAIWWLVRG